MRGISLNSDQTASQDLSQAPLSYTATYGKRFKLDEILINFSQAITETVTITYVSPKGTNYDVVLNTVPLVAQASMVWRPQGEANFQSGDKIKVECTNSNSIGVAYVTVKSSSLGGG